MNWDDIVALDRKLSDIEQFVLQQRLVRDDSYCANWIWYGLFKPLVSSRVGWYRERKLNDATMLSSTKAYEVATRHLYELLPECRHEGGCHGYRDFKHLREEMGVKATEMGPCPAGCNGWDKPCAYPSECRRKMVDVRVTEMEQ